MSSLHDQRGLSSVEIAMLFALVAISLITLGNYLQRGFQGYLRSTAASHGTQFDPTRPFTQTSTLHKLQVKQHVKVLTGQAAVDLFKGEPRLPDTPGGTVPSKMLATIIDTESNWDQERVALHEAQ
jgi:hypothetical protein